MDLSKLPPEQLTALLNGPAAKSPDGVYHLDNPDNQNAMVVGVTIASLVLTTILVLIRAYSRLVMLRRVAFEDFLALAAYGNFVGLIYILIHVAYKTPGWYVHQWDFRLKDTAPFAFGIHVGSNLITAVILCMKTAILLEWVRIFVPGKTRNGFFWASWALLVANAMFYVAGIFAENFSCFPYRSIWDKTVSGSKCLDIKALDLASAVIDLVSDIAVLILPQMVIWRLQMSNSKRLGVSIMFAMGIFGCICGAFRLAASVAYYTSEDSTYTVCSVAVWALGELVALFLVFCIPAVPKAASNLGLSAIASSLRSWTGGKSSGSGSGSKTSGRGGSAGFAHRQSATKLSDLSAKRTPLSESTENLKEEAFANDGILRTTHVISSVHDDSLQEQTERTRRQHPW